MEGRVCVGTWRPYQQTGLEGGLARAHTGVCGCVSAPPHHRGVPGTGDKIGSGRGNLPVTPEQAAPFRQWVSLKQRQADTSWGPCVPPRVCGEWRPWKGPPDLGIKSHTAPAAGQTPAGPHSGLAGPSEGAELCWLDEAAFTVAFDEILPELGGPLGTCCCSQSV